MHANAMLIYLLFNRYISNLTSILVADDIVPGSLSFDSWSIDSNFVTLFYGGFMIGALISFTLSDNLGRKKSIIIVTILCILALLWSSLTFSSFDLIISRILLGLSLGILLSACPLYLVEVSIANYRGRSIAFIIIGSIIGSLIAEIFHSLLGSYAMGWRICFLIPITPIILVNLSLFVLPESPQWLLAHTTPSDCIASLKQLRRTNDITTEFNHLYLALSNDARLGDSWIDILQSRSTLYQIYLCSLLQFSQQICGIQVISMYGIDLLSALGLHNTSVGLNLANLASLIGIIIAFKKIDIWGRRFILSSGCICMTISWIGAAFCIYYGGLQDGRAELYFKSFILKFLFGSFLCLFACFYSFSIGPLSWVVSAEIFPLHTRGKAAAITTFCYGLGTLFGLMILTNWSNNGYDAANSMLVFAVVATSIGFIMYISLPETKNIMLEDMQELFDIDNHTFCNFFCLAYDPQFKMVGLRVLQDGIADDDAATKKSADFRSSKHSKKYLTVEPTTLHKYSSGMMETRFQYYQSNMNSVNEFDPLIKIERTVGSKTKSTTSSSSGSIKKNNNFLIPDAL